MLSEAFVEMEAGSERVRETELYRIKGELLLTQNASNAAEAEHSFRKAIEVARRQEAKFYELRATMSLAELFQKQGKTDEARKMIAEIYGWFTEGFGTVDLGEMPNRCSTNLAAEESMPLRENAITKMRPMRSSARSAAHSSSKPARSAGLSIMLVPSSARSAASGWVSHLRLSRRRIGKMSRRRASA